MTPTTAEPGAVDGSPETPPRADPNKPFLPMVFGLGALGCLFATLQLLHLIDSEASDLPGAQRATKETFGRFLDAQVKADVNHGLRLDTWLILAYAGFGVLLFLLFWALCRGDRGRRRTAGVFVGIGLVVAGAVADFVENGILHRALDRDDLADVGSSMLGAMRAAGLLRYLFLATALVALLVLLFTRERDPYDLGRPGDKPDGVGSDWDPPAVADGGEPRVGVCLSGGGIRSAAFSLGGLQALQEAGVMARADYLSAASGGGYLAAGWALSDAGPPPANPDAPPPPPPPNADTLAWSRGSPEERWFRDHSSYLVPDLLGGLRGVGRLLAGVAINIVLIWLLLFVIARPVGWAIGEIHPELRAVEPVAIPTDAKGEMVIGTSMRELDTVEVVVDGAAVMATRYHIDLGPAPTEAGDDDDNQVCFDTDPFNRGADECFAVEPSRPVTVAVRAGRAEVVRQPQAHAVSACTDPELGPRPSADTCEVFDRIEVLNQPTVSLREATVTALDRLPFQLEVSTQPTFRTQTGLVGRPDLDFSWWMWEASLGPLAAAALVGLVMMSRRWRGTRYQASRFLALTLALTGLGAFALAVVLPSLILWLPTLGQNVSLSDPRLRDFLLPTGGLVGIALTAAGQFLSSNRTGTGTGPAQASTGDAPVGIFGRIRSWLTKGKEPLGWYELSPMKILVGLLILAGFVTFFVTQLQYASANGPFGRLLGAPFVRPYIPTALWLPEWTRWSIVLGVLVGFAMAVDAHVWSLYPFYKRALTSGYLVRRKPDGRAKDIGYETVLPLTPDPAIGWNGLVGSTGREGRRGPMLILCCAVNLSEYGRVPPGRRAASFTFAPDYIGGPLVGYQAAESFWNFLPPSRQRDITLASAMAISGAAFSPAMGKKNLGPVGSVLAIANLRLGVWLPHPQRVTLANRDNWHSGYRPGWLWFLREVGNSYKFQRRYLYVSDGGHWENLGLVELLRRGCTEIVCISAAGDGATGFGTICEAIALAREELGITWVDFDPSPLRPPTKAGEPPPARELRRAGARNVAEPFAGASYITGTFEYPGGIPGTVLYIETDLTADLPFDVHGFAESEAIFPDDSTADQVFNHRQFEAFRALGYFQVAAALAPSDDSA